MLDSLSHEKSNWVIVGAGGHGRQILNTLSVLQQNVLGFLDDNTEKHGNFVANLPVLGSIDWLKSHNKQNLAIALGIGSSAARKSVVTKINAIRGQHTFPPIIHPMACIGSRISIGEGTFIEAGCILTCDIHIGSFAVINVGCRLAHDVKIGHFSTVAGSSHLTGGCICEDLVEIGVGTVAIPGKKIGNNSRTGAGSVIIDDVSPGVTVIGIPARELKNSRNN